MTRPVNFPQEPKYLWDIFYNFTQTPRPSKHEQKIAAYIMGLAKEANLEFAQDDAGNILIRVPGSAGREHEEPLLIQNHIDMVTDAAKGVDFNFMESPLNLEVSGDWVKAHNTTLGADNGIGCAAALATIFDTAISHPPLELLFTVDEETGLHGALNLNPALVKANRMLNLDSEQWGTLYIGCAGGIDCELNKEVKAEYTSGQFYKLEIGGLTGGHSGLDIHRDRGNAIKMLADLLYRLKSYGLQLAEFRGGKAHNIIPRDAFAILKIKDVSQLENIVDDFSSEYLSFLAEEDRNFSITLHEMELEDQSILSEQDSVDFVNFLSLFPHGVHGVDNNTSDRVISQSNNLAITLLVKNKIYTLTSIRFFDRQQIKAVERSVAILAESYGFKLRKNSEYPSWKPEKENAVLETVKAVYKNVEGSLPEVTAIHAGLECGILMSKIGKIDAVSFGPTIVDAHSPQERVSISSVNKFWDLYTQILAQI